MGGERTAVVGLLDLDGEKVIKSLCHCQSPPLSFSLSRSGRRRGTEGVESGHDDEHNVDRWTALSVCAKERKRDGRFGQIFSLPFFTGERGVAEEGDIHHK